MTPEQITQEENRRYTQPKIEVMQAFLDGKPIESRSRANNNWGDCRMPNWDWGLCDFRIKQEDK